MILYICYHMYFSMLTCPGISLIILRQWHCQSLTKITWKYLTNCLSKMRFLLHLFCQITLLFYDDDLFFFQIWWWLSNWKFHLIMSFMLKCLSPSEAEQWYKAKKAHENSQWIRKLSKTTCQLTKSKVTIDRHFSSFATCQQGPPV